jgi:hypothetical protein
MKKEKIKEERKMVSIYMIEEDFNFLKAYCKAWDIPYNGYVSDLLSNEVIRIKNDIDELNKKNNIIEEELKK